MSDVSNKGLSSRLSEMTSFMPSTGGLLEALMSVKPCTVCGKDPEAYSTVNGWTVGCEKNGHHLVFVDGLTRDDAIRAWNDMPRYASLEEAERLASEIARTLLTKRPPEEVIRARQDIIRRLTGK